MSRNKLYVYLSAACILGYSWLFFFLARSDGNFKGTEVCLFKYFTHLPCPSCGSTRAVLLLIQGDFWGAFFLNPLGYLIFIVLLIVPLWIVVDLITAKATLHSFYRKSENLLSQKSIAIPLIFIVVINWIWNLYKGV